MDEREAPPKTGSRRDRMIGGSPWLTKAEVQKHIDAGCLPPQRLDPVFVDQEFNYELDPRVRNNVDPIEACQRRGQCTGCRKGKPDRNGTCTGDCELWWPVNGNR